MKETELTVQVLSTRAEIENVIKKKCLIKTEEFSLEDWYYSTPSDADNFCYDKLISKSLLVRKVISNTETNELIYKNKKFDENGNCVAEEKTKVIVDSIEKTLKIFDQMGLKNWCHVKNNSTTYKYNEYEFCFQNVENLGLFIEFEEEKFMQDMPFKEKVELMKSVLNSLGLKLGDNYFCKKIEMLIKK